MPYQLLRTNCLLLLLGVASTCLAQDQPPAGGAGLILKFSPLATQDPITSTLQFDLEYRFAPRWGVQVGYGKQFVALKYSSLGLTDDRYNYKYHKYRAEVRYYLAPDPAHQKREIYIGLQPFYTPQRYTRYGNIYYEKGRYVTYDRAFVEKDIIGLAFKTGLQWHLKRGFLLETGLGFGARYVDVRYDMVNVRKAGGFGEAFANRFNQVEKPETKINMQAELVFKVGYTLPMGRR